ncbi:MAG: phosphate-starvation-inducible PsiE family protein [Planctomycetota bacterium]
MSSEPSSPTEPRHAMAWLTERFEHFVVGVLLIVMMLAILFSTVELVWIFLQGVPKIFQDPEHVTKVFGLVFTVLIGLELLDTIRTVLSKEDLHVEVVFLVAMIAVARKVILLEVKQPEDFVLPLGIGAVILALALGFYLVKLAYRKTGGPPAQDDGED